MDKNMLLMLIHVKIHCTSMLLFLPFNLSNQELARKMYMEE
jgi:hypothetical protein